MSDEIILRRLVNELPKYRFTYRSEKDLHDGIAAVLDQVGIRYEREYSATKAERFDFWLDDGVVLEAKVDGSFPEAARQVDRYCGLEVVRAVAIVTTKQWGDRIFKTHLRGKRIVIIRVKRRAF